MKDLVHLKSDSRIAAIVREQVEQKKLIINDDGNKLALDKISYGFRDSLKGYCYHLEDCLSRRKAGYAASAFAKEDILLLYLLIHLTDGTVFEAFSCSDSPHIIQFYCNGIVIGRLESDMTIDKISLNRVKNWKLFLGDNLWGEIERPMIVSRKNLTIKRIEPNTVPLTITLDRGCSLKEFLRFLFPPFKLLSKTGNNDLVLPHASANELDSNAQKFVFSISVFMRTLVFQFGYGWC